ncbi:MAG TPA: hypothetical protein VF459_10245 [Caulobacteraceae bacterium]
MTSRLARLMIAVVFALASLAMAPVAAHAQSGSDPDSGDQYRCDTSGAHCAYYHCDPSGQSCQRSSDWSTRDYSRGVDGALPYDDGPSYDQRSDADGYARDGDQDRNDYDGGANNAGDEARNDQDDSAQYRCTDDNQRCAYFRCDPDGDNCHRVSGWSSRADADRRPDDNGW